MEADWISVEVNTAYHLCTEAEYLHKRDIECRTVFHNIHHQIHHHTEYYHRHRYHHSEYYRHLVDKYGRWLLDICLYDNGIYPAAVYVKLGIGEEHIVVVFVLSKKLTHTIDIHKHRRSNRVFSTTGMLRIRSPYLRARNTLRFSAEYDKSHAGEYACAICFQCRKEISERVQGNTYRYR